jgi:photosystem II stability/assembly factor-like uncharacterized protein
MHALACIDVHDQFGDIDAAAASSSGDPSLLSDAAVPPGAWANVTANLANMPSECGNLTSVFAKPDEDMLIAGVALHGLWASRDGGGSWQPLGTGSGSAAITNRPTSIVFDPQDSTRWWESGIYGGGGVFRTTDNGLTFTQLGDVTHCDAVSVDMTDPDRRTLFAGGHETAQTLHRSIDGGATWTSVGGNLPAGTNCTTPLVLDAQNTLVGCGGYGGGPSGVYRTTDGGNTWSAVTSSGGALAPLRTTSGAIYWANAIGGGITRSTNDGQHWVDAGQGVIDRPVRPIEMPDGRVATLGSHYVVITADQGLTWKPASAKLPYDDAVGLAYSSQRKAFFIWHFSCGQGDVPVPADAVMRFDFDYQKY